MPELQSCSIAVLQHCSLAALQHPAPLQSKEHKVKVLRACPFLNVCPCRRLGSQDVEVVLHIEVDNQPDRYTLSASLSAVLGLKQATRTTVLHTLWAYIKTHRLQVFLSGIQTPAAKWFPCDSWLEGLHPGIKPCRNVCWYHAAV